MIQLGRDLGRRTMDEPINFVKNAMVCGYDM